MPQDITNPNNNPNLGLVMAQVDDADGNIVVTLIELLTNKRGGTLTDAEARALSVIEGQIRNLSITEAFDNLQPLGRLDDGGAE
jgi:hypothetical protein|tara:strand:- start:351 stop:602 length:252 start_codon:yes stop_codon:yes gene_type:complete